MLGNNKKILGNNEIFGVLDVGLLFRFSGRDRHQTSVVQLLVLLFFLSHVCCFKLILFPLVIGRGHLLSTPIKVDIEK